MLCQFFPVISEMVFNRYIDVVQGIQGVYFQWHAISYPTQHVKIIRSKTHNDTFFINTSYFLEAQPGGWKIPGHMSKVTFHHS